MSSLDGDIDEGLFARNPRQYILAIILTDVLAWIVSVVAIFGLKAYGVFIFLVLPSLIGFLAPWIYLSKEDIPSRWGAFWLGCMALLVYAAGLLIFAIEGIICIGMAAPLGMLLVLPGSALAFRHKGKWSLKQMAIPLLLVPGTLFTDAALPPGGAEHSASSSIVIDAPPAAVWKYVVAYSELPPPAEALFRMGISYPTRVTLAGKGVGAVRECRFNTGSLLEPITVWEEGRALEFLVFGEPVPMKEVSFWDIDPPHLHGYFVSTRGRFDLAPLPGGRTRLTGTSWFKTKLRPEPYWNLWTRHIIHLIHGRVFRHIRERAEAA